MGSAASWQSDLLIQGVDGDLVLEKARPDGDDFLGATIHGLSQFRFF